MGQCSDAWLTKERSTGKIAKIIFEPMIAQRCDDRLFVNNRIARKIQQRSAGLHRGEPLAVDQMMRHRQQRDVQRHEIRMLQQFLDAVRAPHARRQPPRGVHGDFRIEAGHSHAELDRGIGNEAADGAKSDDAQCFSGQLDPGEALLAFLDALLEIPRCAV